MADINVLSVIHYPVFGGPHNRNALVANCLASAGIETHIVIPESPGNADSRLREMGIVPERVPLSRLRKTVNPIPNVRLAAAMARDVMEIRRVIRRTGANVVLVNGTGNPHGALAARAEGVPVVWQLLDTYPPLVGLAAVMPMIRKLSTVIMSTGLTTAAMHPGAIEFEGPLVTFGPCVPVDRFVARPDVARAARRELGISDGEFVVGNVANINRMKGHHTFLEAAAQFRRKHPARFVILGGVGDEGYVRSILQHAHALGMTIDRDVIIRNGGGRVHELAQAFDLFWMTSEPRSEGMPTAVAEAQALGLPVVASRTGGVHECFIEGESGYLVAPHDVGALVERSMRLAADPVLRARFSSTAAEFARRNFSVEATSRCHRDAYEAAIGR